MSLVVTPLFVTAGVAAFLTESALKNSMSIPKLVIMDFGHLHVAIVAEATG